MFFPYGTDAPVYHFPWMTIGLIVTNIIVAAQTKLGLYSEGWLLTYGNQLRPLEWLTYNFVHLSPMHLIMNMFFLWSFGIVVEGKLGWYRFLALYLGIGILGGVLIQSCAILNTWDDANPPQQTSIQSTSSRPIDASQQIQVSGPNNVIVRRAGGSSLVIFGLMATVLVWAPLNSIEICWIWFIYYTVVGTFRMWYLFFCGAYILLELWSSGLFSGNFQFGSASGHAVGALIGLAVGIALVKLNGVDCEGWDLFNAFSEKRSSIDEVGAWRNKP